MLYSKLASFSMLMFLVTSCKQANTQLDYSDYVHIFQLEMPDENNLIKAWSDDAGVTNFFEFSISSDEYSEISELSKTNGFSESKLMDGHFGKWEAINSSDTFVFGQSKVTNFGNIYYFYEGAASRLTAIARYTSGR